MMESTFQNRVFLVILLIGCASMMILFNQSGYLSRHRLFDRSQDHSHRSRMRMHRSQESLRHYQAWSHNKHSLQDAKDAVIPKEEDTSLQYYWAWSKKQHALQNLKEATLSREDDRPLHLYRVWSENQRYLKDAKEATISRKVEVFKKINITKTNNKRWVNSSYEHCTPHKNIVFLKMHKCSSSTVQNILFRYGERHQLDFVLPPTHNILARTLFDSRYMLHFPVKEYNILCHHTRFSAEGEIGHCCNPGMGPESQISSKSIPCQTQFARSTPCIAIGGKECLLVWGTGSPSESSQGPGSLDGHSTQGQMQDFRKGAPTSF